MWGNYEKNSVSIKNQLKLIPGVGQNEVSCV